MKLLLSAAIVAACQSLASATGYGYGYGGPTYAPMAYLAPAVYIEAPSPDVYVAPVTTAPYVAAPAPSYTTAEAVMPATTTAMEVMPATTTAMEVMAAGTTMAPSKGCLPEDCVPGDKKACPITAFQGDVNDCCSDDYCSVCHVNGCNQCCPGTFKPSYAEPCMPCCEYDAKCVMCSDFVGCQQCADGAELVKKGDLFVCQ